MTSNLAGFHIILALEPLGPQGFQLPQTGGRQGIAPLADGLARDAQQLGQRHGRPCFFDGLFFVHPPMVSQLAVAVNRPNTRLM